MGYFIEAADEIITESGIGAVTIRNVADKAGYTSATLYNYFDNLNHLIFLATMKRIEEYNNDVVSRVGNCKNSLDSYLTISECFCEHSFKSPEIYALIFFGNHDSKVEEYTKQHYEFLGNKTNIDYSVFSKVIEINNLSQRSHIMLMDCVNDGYFSSGNAADFNEVAMLLYRSILKDVSDGKIDAKSAVSKNMKYYRQLMRFYIKPEHKDKV